MPNTSIHLSSGPFQLTRPRAWLLLLVVLSCVLGSVGDAGGHDPPTGCPAYDPATSPLPRERLDGLSLPTAAPGTIAGTFSVSEVGEAVYSIPLVVPPGRAGMEPRLAVTYSSSAGEGLLGAGFGLQGLSAVTRCPQNLAQDGVIRAVRYDVDDRFCLDGARLVQVAAQPGWVEYRTFPDSFRKVVAHTPTGWSAARGPQYFEVFTKSGHVIRYGGTEDSRPLTHGGIVASWWMSRERDRRGNAIDFIYEQTTDPADGHTLEIVPKRIEYAHHAGGAASRAVVIDYQSIAPRVSFAGGVKLTHSRLIKEIRMEVEPGTNPTIVRRYGFQYDLGLIPDTGRKVLETVSECTGPEGMGACKPATKLTWSTHFRSLEKTTVAARMRPATRHDYDRSVWLMADVNGDGLDDIVVSEPDADDETQNQWRVSLNLGGKFDLPRLWGTFTYPDLALWWSAGATPMDYDHDGLTDIMLDAPNLVSPHYLWLRAKPDHTFELRSTGIAHPGAVDVGLSNEKPLKAEHHRFMRLGDVNGDGMADMIECIDPSWDVPANSPQDYNLGSASWTVRLWSAAGSGSTSGPGFEAAPIPIPKYAGYDCSFARKEMYVIDTDGDGVSEILLPDPDTGCGGNCQLNYTAQRLAGTTWEPVENTWLPQQTSSRKIHFLDMNADGLPDALYTGFGVVDLDWHEFPVNYGGAPYLVTADWNGDGVIDLADQAGAPWHEGLEMWMSDIPVLAFNKGGEFGTPTPTLAYPEATNDYWTDALGDRAMTLDYNGDGRMDIMMPMFGHCEDPTEETTCWVVMVAPKTGADYFRIIDTMIPYDPPLSGRAHWWSAQVTDIDGDGRPDILVPDQDDPGQFFLYKNDGPQDLLVAVTDGTNPLDPGDPGFVPTVSIQYGNLVDASVTSEVRRDSVDYDYLTYTATADPDNGCAFPRACVVGPARVVKSYAINNGLNGERHFDLKYRDGRYHHLGRGFLGFGARMIWDREAASGQAELFDNLSFDATRKVFPFAHEAKHAWAWTSERGSWTDPGQVEISFTDKRLQQVLTNQGITYYTLPTGTFVERQETTVTPAANESLFKHVQTVITSTPATVLGRSSHIITDYDEYGNILGEEARADGIDLLNAVVRDYDTDPSTWLVGQLTYERGCSTSLNITQCRSSSFSHNGYGEVISASTGDPSDPGTQLARTFLYDGHGHVVHIAAQDYWGNERSACVAYDAQGIFPYSRSNALGHVSYTEYDPGLGVVLSVVDPNGLTTQWAYDGFGRENVEVGPDSRTITHRARSKTAGPQGNWWGTGIAVDSFGGPSTTASLDSFGRTTAVGTAAPEVDTCGASSCSASTSFVSRTTYDAFGRVARVTLPWMKSDALEGQYAHTYEYDAAGRLVRHVEPWGRMTVHTYANNVRTSLDWLGSTSVEVDALGRAIRTVDAGGNVTRMLHGPFSATWQVSRGGSADTSLMEHDAYGRVTHEQDPDRGHTYLSYNGFGDVIGAQDALGRSYSFTYDSVGRLVLRDDPDGTTSWAYDLAPHGVGRLATVTSPRGHVKEHTYDNLSRLSTVALTFGDTGQRLESVFEYDWWGRLSLLTYPSMDAAHPLVIRRDYDDHGNLLAVRNDDTGHAYWTLDVVDGAGRPAIETLGSSDFQTRHTYYPDRALVAGIRTDRGATRLQDIEYGYDNGQRMTRRTTRVGQPGPAGMRSEHFVHDTTNRLACTFWSYADHDLPPPSPGACALALAYAPNGNIVSKSDVGLYHYDDVAHPHAVTSVGDAAYIYDDVGNQIKRPGVQKIAYTAFDLPDRIDRIGADSIGLEYDGDQQRIRKITPEETTLYFEGLYEQVEDRLTGDVKERHYIAAGSATVVLTRADGVPDDVSYLLADALGSTDVVVNGAGQIEQRSFDAFGAPRNPEWGEPAGSMSFNKLGAAPIGYTGHESDSELGLVNMKGRIYDPRLGRFMQTDPIVSDPHFGQGWNPYSYVMNRPLDFVDPSGFQAAPTAPDRPAGCDGSCHLVDGKWIRTTVVEKALERGYHRVTMHAEVKNAGRDDASSRLPIPTFTGDKFNPHSNEGRVWQALFGSEPPPKQWEPPKELVQSVASLAPGGSSLIAFSDPKASALEKFGAVTLDGLSVIGVGAVIKFGVKGARLASGAAKAAKIARIVSRVRATGAGGRVIALDAVAFRNLDGVRKSNLVKAADRLIVSPHVAEELARHGISAEDIASAGVAIAPSSPVGASVVATRIADVLRGVAKGSNKRARSASADALNLAEAAMLDAELFITADKLVLEAFGGRSILPGTGGATLTVVKF